MAHTHGVIEIRSLADLTSLYEVSADITLTKEQYSHPLRPYRLIKPEASCQYQKKGTRCSKMHQHGFVVVMKDSSMALIGHCCAHNHLGLDDDEVRQALTQLTATEKQNIRRHKVETLISQRDTFLSRVKAANLTHRALEARRNMVLQTLPDRVCRVLLNRWRSGKLEVLWDYQIIKTGIDETGKSYTERHWYPHSFGKLKGLGVWLHLEKQHYQERLLDFRRQLEAIPSKARLTNGELEKAEAALNMVAELGVIERELQSQSRLLDAFLDPANLEITIQLISNQKTRAETVRAVHGLRNEQCAITPDRYVAEIDQRLKQRYSSGAIRIAG